MDFTVGSCVRYGWATFKQRPWVFVGMTVLIVVISSVSSQLSSPPQTESYVNAPLFALTLIAVVLGLALSVLVKMGTINFYLKAHDALPSVELIDLWKPHPFWQFIVTGIVVGVIVFIGFVLLIVPGIIWALRYLFAQYLVIDRGMDVSDALAESARLTKGHKGELFLLLLALLGINILGLLCLVVGLLVTMPVSYLALTHAYRMLSRTTPAAPAPTSTPAAAHA